MHEPRELVFLYSARFVPEDILQLVRRCVPQHLRLTAVEQSSGRAERLAAFEKADYVLAYPGDPSADEIAVASRLKLFQILSAGHDWLDVDAFRRAGVLVAGNGGANATTTAEHALLLMLALLKMLPIHHQSMRGGHGLAMQHTSQLRELRGKTVGLVGFGQIGRAVATRVHAFGARVLYHCRTRAAPEIEAACDRVHVSFDRLLAQSDIVSLHAPLTNATRGLMNDKAFAAMRAGAWLVNTARGALVDEVALLRALQSGSLAGAGLDVFAVEPLAIDSPLRSAPNVVLTPHIGGATLDTWERRLSFAFKNIDRVETSVPPHARIT